MYPKQHAQLGRCYPRELTTFQAYFDKDSFAVIIIEIPSELCLSAKISRTCHISSVKLSLSYSWRPCIIAIKKNASNVFASTMMCH